MTSTQQSACNERPRISRSIAGFPHANSQRTQTWQHWAPLNPTASPPQKLRRRLIGFQPIGESGVSLDVVPYAATGFDSEQIFAARFADAIGMTSAWSMASHTCTIQGGPPLVIAMFAAMTNSQRLCGNRRRRSARLATPIFKCRIHDRGFQQVVMRLASERIVHLGKFSKRPSPHLHSCSTLEVDR